MSFNIDTFMEKVIDDSTGFGFSKFKDSKLLPLIEVLKDPKKKRHDVVDKLVKLQGDKQQKYWKALLYLRESYTPKLPPTPLRGGAKLGKLNAAFFKKNTAKPQDWDKDFSGQKGSTELAKRIGYGTHLQYKYEHEIASETNYSLNKTLEQYIIENPSTVAGVLVHLGEAVPELDVTVEGVTHRNHIISVLNSLANVNAPLICVTFENKPAVCGGGISEAANKCNMLVVEGIEGQHMGGHDEDFQDFVDDKPNIIMMGFDGDICVGANSFGLSEVNKATGKRVLPVISKANIITSRAVLVTNNTGITKVEKWGVLHNT